MPSFKLAPQWAAVLEAVAAAASDSDHVARSNTSTGSRSGPMDTSVSTFQPTDHHLGRGPSLNDEKDVDTSAAHNAATSAVDAARHLRVLSGLSVQKSTSGEQNDNSRQGVLYASIQDSLALFNAPKTTKFRS